RRSPASSRRTRSAAPTQESGTDPWPCTRPAPLRRTARPVTLSEGNGAFRSWLLVLARFAVEAVGAVGGAFAQHVAVHGAEHVGGGEAFGQVQAFDVQREHAQEVTVHAQVVCGRVRAVVAEVIA